MEKFTPEQQALMDSTPSTEDLIAENAKLVKSMREAFRMTVQRCHNLNNPDYRYYGGRGIEVCETWRNDFQCFLSDMGLRPEGMTLERKDTNKGYNKENCIWATRKVQANNTRRTVKLTFNGETKGLEEWSEITGIPYGTLKARKGRLGYTDEECLTKPVKPGTKLEGKEYKPRKKPDMSKVSRGFSRSKLSESQVREMQSKYDAGGHTFTSLSREYKVSIETASQICQREHFYA